MKDFASAASGESKSMLDVTQNARNDSSTMRVASLIALVYLPATLIAVSLSQISLSIDSIRSPPTNLMFLFMRSSQTDHLQ